MITSPSIRVCDIVLDYQPVSIVEYFPYLQTLGRLCEAHHVLWAADLDEGEARLLGESGGQGCFARVGRSLQQNTDQTRPWRGASLQNEHNFVTIAILERS